MKVFFSFAEAREYVKNGPFFISHRNTLFPFWWNLTGSKKWTLFTPGRFDRSKPAPSFQRSSFATDLEHNIVSVFDPLLLRDKDIGLGWFIGVRNIDHAGMLADLILELSREFKFGGDNLLIYASSGGGLPALRIAMKLPRVSLYLSNIQTDPRAYYEKAYRRLVRASFPGMNRDEINNLYSNRLCSYGWDGEFRLVYAQNMADEFHYRNHFLPYVDAYTDSVRRATSQFLIYNDPESGHGVLKRNTELGIINAMHQRADITSMLPEGRVFQGTEKRR